MKAHAVIHLLPLLAPSLAAPTTTRNLTLSARAAEAYRVPDPSTFTPPNNPPLVAACELYFYEYLDCQVGTPKHHNNAPGIFKAMVNDDRRGILDMQSFRSVNCEGLMVATEAQCIRSSNIRAYVRGPTANIATTAATTTNAIQRRDDYANNVPFKVGCTNIDRETVKLPRTQAGGNRIPDTFGAPPGIGDKGMSNYAQPLCLVLVESHLVQQQPLQAQGPSHNATQLCTDECSPSASECSMCGEG